MACPSPILERLLMQAVRSGAAPGLVAIVADRDGVRQAATAGVLGVDDRHPIARDAIFWLASCTKLVTAMAALICVERGMLDLDTPISRWVAMADELEVLEGFGQGGEPVLRPLCRPVTLRHLLTHTSGLGYDFKDEALLRYRGSAGPPPAGQLRSLAGPLLFDPGEDWTYGVGTDWVGLAIEAATGSALEIFLDEQICTPLGLTATGFAAAPGRPRAMLHRRTSATTFEQMPCPCDDAAVWEYRSGGGGLYASATDFIRLLRAVLRLGEVDGVRILRPGSAQLLFDNALPGHRPGTLPSAIPAVNAPFDLFPDQPTGWSLGGLINLRDVPGGRRAGSLSWAGIANTHYWIDPAAGVCAVLMAQYMPFADPAMLAALRRFEQAVYSEAASPI
jgi:methyl acetate hydrolase